MIKYSKIFTLVLVLSGFHLFGQDLRLPRLFSSHMVLQRESPVRIWGWAAADQHITVSIDGITINTQADKSGHWECLYPDHPAGGPYQLRVSGGASIEVEDVWFGEVWIAGGQSNMEMNLKADVDNWEAEVADSNYPQIRFFKVSREIGFTPWDDLKAGEWKVANPENARDFSAVAWFFAKHNHVDKNVPVGVIESNWGGTRAEAWTSVPMVMSMDHYLESTREVLDTSIDWKAKLAENDQRNAKKWEIINNEVLPAAGVHLPSYNDNQWKTIVLPSEQALQHVVWLRKTVTLKGSIKNMVMTAGNMFYDRRVFINGKEIENVPSATPFSIPNGYLKKGENVIALRLVNTWNNQMAITPGEEMWLDNGNLKISLEGEWKYANDIEEKIPEVIRYMDKPGTLYNAMIHPIEGYTIRGAIWYQGESNAGQWQDYHRLFEKMILDWRIHWKQGPSHSCLCNWLILWSVGTNPQIRIGQG